jgi:hypothetical protein
MNLDESKIDTIRATMAAISLPPPDWARNMNADEWNAQLLARVRQCKSVAATQKSPAAAATNADTHAFADFESTAARKAIGVEQDELKKLPDDEMWQVNRFVCGIFSKSFLL